MAAHSEAMFVLKVNKNCQACRVRMTVALGSISGVYDIEYSAEEGVVRVRAVVDPNMLMKALAGTGAHAECIGFKLRHPKLITTSYSYNDDSYDPYCHRNGYSHGSIHGPFNSRPTLPFHDGPSSYPYSSVAPYYQQSGPYYHGSDLPPVRYVPSYSSTAYGPYADERYNYCSIM